MLTSVVGVVKGLLPSLTHPLVSVLVSCLWEIITVIVNSHRLDGEEESYINLYIHVHYYTCMHIAGKF